MKNIIDWSYRPGLRAIKTSVAVFTCMLVGNIFWFSNPFYSVISAIMCVQPTLMQSKYMGIHRLAGTIIAAVFSMITLQIIKSVPFDEIWARTVMTPLMGFFIIVVCNYLRLKSAVITASITFIVIVFTNPLQHYSTIQHVTYRTVDTVIGVGIGLLINKFFFRKKSLEQLIEHDKLKFDEFED